ncbi:E3 ubiquitin- ligase TRIM39-like protein [Labeo rohita]|uniref:E3 ubiquitin-ligase TRIM39-like protein n=1 Tax=Labeo rohita TaxID=84645 RepID=A0A498LRC2_LABRO|nr:E3 ubiquitin- ligase TRIM39-like protein [Labeo rohita]
MSPHDGYWVVGLWNENEYWTCTDSYVLLSLRGKPEKMGVFVDYEEGLVSFYDVEYRSHIYSYTGIKAQLMKTQKDVQQMILDRIRKIQDIEYFAERRKKNTEREKAANVELFRDLIRSIESCQAELLEMMAKKQKAAQKQDKKLIQELQQEITELKMRNSKLDHLLHTEDHLHFLQIDQSQYRAPDPRNWPEISMNTDTQLVKTQKDVQQMIQDRIKKIQDIKHSAELRKDNTHTPHAEGFLLSPAVD